MAKTVTLKDLLEKDNEKLIDELQFEEGLQLLEELVSGVESGALPLEKSILSYEKGVALCNALRDKLSGAEEKVKRLQLQESQSE